LKHLLSVRKPTKDPPEHRTLMIEKALKDIAVEDIMALVTAGRTEGRTIDFKAFPPATFNDAEKKELARDVSSFANAAGGDIVFGVEEEGGVAKTAPGFACDDADKLMLQMDGIIRDNIDPRVAVEMRRIPGFGENRIVLVIRVQRSWNAPHMVKGTPLFYSRTDSGKQPLDVRQVRAAFIGGADVARRARSFRDERIGRVLADETPVRLNKDGPVRLITHVMPLIDEGDAALDLATLQSSMAIAPPMPRGASAFGWSHRYNLDGFVTFPFDQDSAEAESYYQAFRLGGFEAVVPMPRMGHTPPRLYVYWVENRFVDCARLFLKALTSLRVSGPVVCMMSLTGARGYQVYASDGVMARLRDTTIDRNVVVLPDVVFESERENVTGALRASFDVLWQAGGWERSHGYDAQGTWDASKHAD